MVLDGFGEAADGAFVADEAVAVDRDAEEQGVGVAVGAVETMRRRLPLVSPFIHSLLRVRLKKVTKPVSRVWA